MTMYQQLALTMQWLDAGSIAYAEDPEAVTDGGVAESDHLQAIMMAKA